MNRIAVAFSLLGFLGGCAFMGVPEKSDAPAATAEPTAVPTSEPVAEASASASAATPSTPTSKSFDLSEHGIEVTIELPASATLAKRSGKVGGVDIEGVESAGWKRGLTVLKGDAAHSTPAQWKAMMASKMKASVAREEGDLITFTSPSNTHSFVLFVRKGKDTFVCQNYGSLDAQADLEAK
jgi:pyruvate/2-oxoglutarate dehydrogenase complex dihydrolipoamide acyltransferase (E2) component